MTAPAHMWRTASAVALFLVLGWPSASASGQVTLSGRQTEISARPFRLSASTVLQNAASGALQQSRTQAQPQPQDPSVADRVFNMAEPDFTLVTLPTNLRMPARRLAFRLTHRFSRPLDGGPGYGNALEDLFGFDSSAVIGLELRYGLRPGTQIGIHRGNNKTIQMFGRQTVLAQRDGRPLNLDAFVSVEGLVNFRREYSTTLGAVVSRQIPNRASFYIEPMWVKNAAASAVPVDEEDAVLLGLGARVRVLVYTFLVAEYVPRVSGVDTGSDNVTFGIEKRIGGHLFQLNFSRGLGTTPAQQARGATDDDWFIGFNITRKFF